MNHARSQFQSLLVIGATADATAAYVPADVEPIWSQLLLYTFVGILSSLHPVLLLLPHPDLAVRGGVYRRRRLEMSFFHLADISCKPIPRRISRSI